MRFQQPIIERRERPVRPPCRDVDDKAERFARLKAEFHDWPDEAGMERMIEAFWLMKKAGQDRRCLSIEAELQRIERDARQRIAQRKRAGGLA